VTDELFDELGLNKSDFRVHVCLGPNCSPKGSRKLLEYLDNLIWEKGLQSKVEVIGSSCRDRCDYGPSVNVYPGPTLYNHIDETAIDEIVEQHLIDGKVVTKYVFTGKSRR
jgi:NADP-reducing hydrogenase subunit HndC